MHTFLIHFKEKLPSGNQCRFVIKSARYFNSSTTWTKKKSLLKVRNCVFFSIFYHFHKGFLLRGKIWEKLEEGKNFFSSVFNFTGQVLRESTKGRGAKGDSYNSDLAGGFYYKPRSQVSVTFRSVAFHNRGADAGTWGRGRPCLVLSVSRSGDRRAGLSWARRADRTHTYKRVSAKCRIVACRASCRDFTPGTR